MSRLKHVSKSVLKVSGQLFDRKFITLGRLLEHWNLIVGYDYARTTTPIKITRSTIGKTKKYSLLVSTNSAQALQLHYKKDLILEKINQIIGETMITDLKFIDQSSYQASQQSKTYKDKQTNPKSLSQEQAHKLNDMIHDISDEDFKNTLKTFGQSVLINTNNVNHNEDKP